MRLQRIIAGGAAACAALAVTAAGGAASARSNTPEAGPVSVEGVNDCLYPMICLYRTQADWDAHHRTASFKGLPNTELILGPGQRGSAWISNTRGDGGVLSHYTNGRTFCLPPGHSVDNGDWILDRIRVTESPACEATPPPPAPGPLSQAGAPGRP